MLYMLDTDTSSYIIRGGYKAVDGHLAATRSTDRCISAMTRAELIYGLKAAQRRIIFKWQFAAFSR